MTTTESFERAFVAITYLLGRRTALSDGLAHPSEAARRATELLSAPERTERARRLAAHLHPIALELDSRRFR